MKRAIWILWPSFLVGGAAETVFFTLFDPMDMHVLGHPMDWSRTAVYTLGFFVLWAICAAASTMSCFMQATSRDAKSGKV